MELAVIVLTILAIGCFYEYNHLSKNNIRHDENIFAVFGVLCLLGIVVILIYHPYIFTQHK